MTQSKNTNEPLVETSEGSSNVIVQIIVKLVLTVVLVGGLLYLVGI